MFRIHLIVSGIASQGEVVKSLRSTAEHGGAVMSIVPAERVVVGKLQKRRRGHELTQERLTGTESLLDQG